MRISSSRRDGFVTAWSAQCWRRCARHVSLLAAATRPSDHSKCFRRSSHPALEPTAGSWRMIVLTEPEPDRRRRAGGRDIGRLRGGAGRHQVDARRILRRRSAQAIAYWSGGGVMRWNQILRELVARYNLPPAPRDEGGYPVPDAENPFGDPAFPVRQSGVCGARLQLRERRAVRRTEIGVVLEVSVQPAVASEKRQGDQRDDAGDGPSVVSVGGRRAFRASRSRCSSRCSPRPCEEITLKAAEQRNAALWSGKATASDLAAGLALGKSVATVFLARAAADGMRTAGGSAVLWQALADAATARGEIAWKSRDIPARPPMLPLFGQVRAWMHDAGGYRAPSARRRRRRRARSR